MNFDEMKRVDFRQLYDKINDHSNLVPYTVVYLILISILNMILLTYYYNIIANVKSWSSLRIRYYSRCQCVDIVVLRSSDSLIY